MEFYKNAPICALLLCRQTTADGETLLFGRAYTRYLVIALQAYFNKAKIAAFGSALLLHINESGGNEKRRVMTNVSREADTPSLLSISMQFRICFRTSEGAREESGAFSK